MIIAQPSSDRIDRLKSLLADVTAKYGPDASLTRQIARNLAAARAALHEAQDRADTGDTSPEAS